MSEEKLKPGFIALGAAVVAGVLALSALFGYVAFSSGLSELGPLFAEGDTLEGAVINSLIFLLLALSGAGLFLLLIRKRRLSLLRSLLALSLALSMWIILEIYLEFFLPDQLAPPILVDAVSLSLSLLLGVLVLKPVSVALANAFLMLYGTMAGALFAALLTPLSTVLVALTLAVYDAYSVLRGPLRKLLETMTAGPEGDEKGAGALRGAVLQLGRLSLGMGDVLVYSMLSPVFLLSPSPSAVRWLISSSALLAGFVLTLQMLSRRRFMPALPIPVALSLSTYALCCALGI